MIVNSVSNGVVYFPPAGGDLLRTLGGKIIFLTNKKACLVRRKEMKRLRRSLIYFYYLALFGDDIRQAHAIKKDLLSCKSHISQLLLSSLQFKSFSQDV